VTTPKWLTINAPPQADDGRPLPWKAAPSAEYTTVPTPPRMPRVELGVLICACHVWLTCPPTNRSTPLASEAAIRPVPAAGL
jgi:hypothetical protein